MAGRIKIEPYKPLDTHPQPVPGGGYIHVDASVGSFGPSPLSQLGLQVAEGAAGIATVVSQHLAADNEAVVKAADARLGEAEQALLFDPQTGYLNRQGHDALTQAPAVLDAYREAQDRELTATADDDQHQMLRQLSERRLASFSSVVERHSAAERQRWHDEAGDRRIALMRADAALHWSDDALLRRALGTTRAEVRERAERHSWDSPLTEATLSHETSHILASAIGAAVERDPDRAQDLRTRYDRHIEAPDRAALDALLSEAQTRRRVETASAEILNATPPEGAQPTPRWRLTQAEAITEPSVRTAVIRRLRSVDTQAEAHARALAERVLARVLKDGLTDSSQIPVRDWTALDAERRKAIETRLDHNAAGTEPAPNPKLVDELATEMTQAPNAFARHDLVPAVAHLPLPQWQRFRDLQAGVRRNDPAIQDDVYAVKRGLQLTTTMLPPDTPDDIATNYRVELVEEIGTWRRINGKGPDDTTIEDMLKRRIPTESYVTRTLEDDPRDRPELLQVRDDTTTYWPNLNAFKRLLELVIGAEASRQLNEAMRSMSKGVQGDTKAFAEVVGLKPADGYPGRIVTNGENVYFNPQTGRYLVRNHRGRRGFWIEFDERGELVGVVDMTLNYPTPRDRLSPEQVKEWTEAETLPAADPLPPSPPPHVPAPPVPPIISTPIPPPADPSIVWTPILPPAKPQIMETRARRWNDNEPWEAHHHIPQKWWQYGRPDRIPFSKDAVDYFDMQTVEIPKDEHWSDLHDAYNQAAGKALKDYLKKNKEPGETWEEFAGRMKAGEAKKCYEYMIDAILNPPKGLDRDVAKRAKEFLENVSLYVPKKKP